ncbi:MAG: hypothetical protein CM15mP125_1390 [Gammaproteobacteria bacterium]|nr:MAG: hypothetical protein CM15mP125_1390 [Gammaproteobacteria bacterium]
MQLRSALAESQPNLLIAYEPVWAIGTGLTATPDQANEMHAMIKQEVESLFGASQATPVLSVAVLTQRIPMHSLPVRTLMVRWWAVPRWKRPLYGDCAVRVE